VFHIYKGEIEASIALAELQICGIEGYLTHENSIDLFVPEFRLHIFENDYDNAKRILIDEKIICPSCKVKNWEPISAWRKLYFGFLLLLEIKSSLSSQNEFHCKNCGNFF
jgi:hypothetical protein